MKSSAVDDSKATKRYCFRVGSEVREYNVDGICELGSRVAMRVDVRGVAIRPFVSRVRRIVWSGGIDAYSGGQGCGSLK